MPDVGEVVSGKRSNKAGKHRRRRHRQKVTASLQKASALRRDLDEDDDDEVEVLYCGSENEGQQGSKDKANRYKEAVVRRLSTSESASSSSSCSSSSSGSSSSSPSSSSSSEDPSDVEEHQTGKTDGNCAGGLGGPERPAEKNWKRLDGPKRTGMAAAGLRQGSTRTSVTTPRSTLGSSATSTSVSAQIKQQTKSNKRTSGSSSSMSFESRQQSHSSLQINKVDSSGLEATPPHAAAVASEDRSDPTTAPSGDRRTRYARISSVVGLPRKAPSKQAETRKRPSSSSPLMEPVPTTSKSRRLVAKRQSPQLSSPKARRKGQRRKNAGHHHSLDLPDSSGGKNGEYRIPFYSNCLKMLTFERKFVFPASPLQTKTKSSRTRAPTGPTSLALERSFGDLTETSRRGPARWSRWTRKRPKYGSAGSVTRR